MKLYTLKNLSSYASDAVFKICLSLDKYGVQENVGFDDYDALLFAAKSALGEGEHIIIAAETQSYNQFKIAAANYFSLLTEENEKVRELILKNSSDEISPEDMSLYCSFPRDGVLHESSDGFYCAFSAGVLGGTLSFMPLDFMRIDGILQKFDYLLQNGEKEAEPEDEIQESEETEPTQSKDYFPNVKRMIDTLLEKEKKIALATGEGTMCIYELYEEIPSLVQCVSFVELSDDEEVSEEENAEEEESESVKLVKKVREAMDSSLCEMGGAISEIFTDTDEDGNETYYAFAAVVDSSGAKTKKLSTTEKDDLELLLPNAVAILCDSVTDRLTFDGEGEGEKKKEKFMSKNMIIFACIVLAISLAVPLGVYLNIKNNNDEPSTNYNQPSANYQVQSSDNTTSGSNPFGVQTPTLPTANNTEPSAEEVSADDTTAPSVSSTKGVFTFYVFGYGHGVGMSQVGANYLASQGWSAAEILAHYYYDPNTKIVTGDKYPEKITYNDNLYDTREYLASALESEMGSSFSYEALKAQAIALYTFAKYNSYNLKADAHSFGKTPGEVCYRAVDDVMKNGYYIAYGDDVAITPFHAMSAGITTSYYNVWGKGIGASVPYLAGGRKSYGDYVDQSFKSTYIITSEDLKALVKKNLSVDLTGDPAMWISVVTHDKAVRDDIGYVSSINVGGKIITGNEFRIKVMEGKIRSHCFTIVYTPDT